MSDSSGNIVSTYAYDVWGNVTTKTGTVETPFGYAGEYGNIYDKETGLFFLKTRYYDSGIGRFTTRDRFKGFENRPASQNQYSYCENDPINNVDLNGAWAVKVAKTALITLIKLLRSGKSLEKFKPYLITKDYDGTLKKRYS